MKKTAIIKPLSAAFILTMTLFLYTCQGNPEAAWAYSENDLRDATGSGRLTVSEIQKETDAQVARLARDNAYNSIVGLINKEGIKTEVSNKTAGKAEKAYRKLISDFDSGKTASDVITDFSDYNRYSYIEDDSYGITDNEKPDYTDTSAVEKKIQKLKVLKQIAGYKGDIGKIADDFPGLTKKALHVKSIGKGTVRFDIVKGVKIYSAFNGVILKTDKNSVTASAGKTIRITYEGITPDVKTGQKIKQKDVIGRSSGRTLRVSATMNGRPLNILTAWGSSGIRMYEEYISENPWKDDILDTDRIKTSVKNTSAKKKKKQRADGYYYDNGQKKEIHVQTPEKTKNNTYIYSGDPFEDKDAEAKKASE